MNVTQADSGAAVTTATRSGIPRWLWLVVGLGLVYGALAWFMERGAGASRLWWLDPLLLVGYVAGLWWRRNSRPRGGLRWAGLVFVALSWLTGMLYELSLRTGAAGFGGMHPDTTTSFLLAQGFYVPLAVGGWLLARRFGYSAETVFWTGALASLYELITVGVPAVLGQPSFLLLAPLLAGYYLTVYGYFLALPLLFMDERCLWASAPRPISRLQRAALGVALGLVCWAIFIGWAALL